jgi:bifunctional DNA-binding transcriptional regulator/antitoxin component of YhaV-PrlF toxin-antitoxin module
MNETWTVTIEEDEHGEVILPFPPELIEKYGWLEGDEIDFEIDDNSVVIINLSAKQRQTEQGLG